MEESSPDVISGEGMEKKYNLVIENSPDLIAVVSEDGKFLNVNSKMAQSFGLDKEKLTGRYLFEVVPEKFAKEQLRMGKKAIEEGKSQIFESSRDGRYFHNIIFSIPGEKAFVIVARDITEIREAGCILKEREEKYRTIVENSTTGIYIYQDKKFIFVNKTMEKLTGYTKKEFLSMNYLKLMHPDHREKMEKVLNKLLAENVKDISFRFQFIVIRKDGENVWMEDKPAVIRYRGKAAILGSWVDVTEHKRIREKVENLGILYREIGKAVNASSSLDFLCEEILSVLKTILNYDMADILVYNADKNTLNLGAQIGYPDDLKKKTIKEQKIDEKNLRVEVFCFLQKKPIYITDVQKSPLTEYARYLYKTYDVSQIYVLPLVSRATLEGIMQVLVCSGKTLSKEDRELLDIASEEIAAGIVKIKAEEKLRELAEKDFLTGLYNIQRLWQEIKEQENRNERYGEDYSIIYLDIDNFKACNDTYGHLEGDKVLKTMGEILRDSLRKADSAYRYGGEEFAVLLPHTCKEEARKVAERIREGVRRRLYPERKITVSIGVSDSKTDKDVIRAADRAMYEAKREGKDKIKVI